MKNFEKIYNSMLDKTFKYASPVKRIITTPSCKVHMYINDESIDILYNNNYHVIGDFYKQYYQDLTEGTIWADQDFKSSSHLYNPYTKKGLYGRKNAMDVGIKYYNNALKFYKDDKNKALFYFGATLHIIQDMTVPHHASVRLLNNHKQLESYIRKNYISLGKDINDLNPHLLSNIAHYINFNGKEALRIYDEAIKLHKQGVHLNISNSILPLAKRTTAGCMIKFYNDIGIPN